MNRVAAGFALAEAPVVAPGGTLLVSDVIVGGVRRFDSGGEELSPFVERRRGIGGMVVRSDGSVVASGRDLSVVSTAEEPSVLAEPGPGGTGFNDLSLTPAGGIVAGLLTCHPFEGGALSPGRLLHLDGKGDREVTRLAFNWPNGIGFSPLGDRIYVADFAEGVVHAGAWHGSVADLALDPWYVSPSGDADGMAIDANGHLWLASGAGGSILRIDADGQLVETIDVPDDFVSSCCLWPEQQRLVVTTGTGVFFHDLGRGTDAPERRGDDARPTPTPTLETP